MTHPSHTWVDYDPTAGTVPQGGRHSSETAAAHLASLPAERRAQLECEWNDPDFVFDAFNPETYHVR